MMMAECQGDAFSEDLQEFFFTSNAQAVHVFKIVASKQPQ